MLAGILGHDLRNPLSAITMSAQTALAQNIDEKTVRAVSRTLASGQRMARMIDQLLDSSHVRLVGGLPVEATSIDLLLVVRQVIDELNAAHLQSTIRLDREGSSRGVCDADRPAQVFSNLVVNALLHGMGDHRVDIRVDGSQTNIVRVEVRNMGTIPAALLSNVFEPQSGGERTPDNKKGLGLGLFISREIVKAHVGKIEVRSDEATGTAFTVLLPRGPHTREQPAAIDVEQSRLRPTLAGSG